MNILFFYHYTTVTTERVVSIALLCFRVRKQDADEFLINDFSIVRMYPCGRCLFRAVITHGVAKIAAATRHPNGFICDTEIQALEVEMADKLRMEVVRTVEVKYLYYK
jgi:hypothetical protein